MKELKVRIDQLLVERAMAPSREKARALLMAGEVFVNDKRVDKAGTAVPAEAVIEIRGRGLPFASRGGFKLEKALKAFAIKPEGFVCGDIGASTGGFTDCLLKSGAAKVYAVDVGRGQLTLKLSQDPRVVVLDRTNARTLTHQEIPDELDLATMDLSFISLELVLPAVKGLVKPEGRIISLVKPQFEAGQGKVGHGGVVRDPEVHCQVLQKITTFAASIGLHTLGLTFSPIKGPAGNVEFLACFTPSPAASDSFLEDFDYRQLVDLAREQAVSHTTDIPQ